MVLLLVLLTVVVALGLLVAALVSGTAAWAWWSVAASAVAGVLILVDHLRRRSAERPGRAARSPDTRVTQAATAVPPDVETRQLAVDPEPSGSAGLPSGAQASDEDAGGDSSPTVSLAIGTGEDPDEEPAEPAVVALVTTLSDEVLVVDEHPRYHVAGCAFLRGRPIIPLPVGEAVELGFTGCAWCAPNRVLVHRQGAETPG